MDFIYPEMEDNNNCEPITDPHKYKCHKELGYSIPLTYYIKNIAVVNFTKLKKYL